MSLSLKNTEVEDLVNIEKETKKNLKKAAKISDAGERLLEYNTLKNRIFNAMDQRYITNGWVREVHEFRKNGAITGTILGAVPTGVTAGVLGGLALAATILSGGLAAVAGIGLLAGFTGAGALLGKAVGQVFFNHLPADQKHANRLLELWDDANDNVNALKSSSYDNINALMKSSQLEKVKTTFPALVDVFKKQAELDESRKNLFATPAPAVKEAEKVVKTKPATNPPAPKQG